jgi:hypothetical protein
MLGDLILCPLMGAKVICEMGFKSYNSELSNPMRSGQIQQKYIYCTHTKFSRASLPLKDYYSDRWCPLMVEEHLELLSLADTHLGYEALATIIFKLKNLVSLPKVQYKEVVKSLH